MVMTRREVLIAGGLAAGAALAPRVAAAAPPQALTSRRATTFRSFVATLRSAPDGRFDSWEPRSAAKALGRWYARQPAAMRAHADAVLDGLATHAPLRYGRLAGADSAIVAAALGLGAIACEPPPGEDEKPQVVGLAT